MSNQAELLAVESRIQYELMACKALPRSPSIRFSAHELELILARLAASAPAGDAVAWMRSAPEGDTVAFVQCDENSDGAFPVYARPPAVEVRETPGHKDYGWGPLYGQPPAVEVREALAAEFSPETKAALKEIDDNRRHAALNAHTLVAGAPALSASPREMVRESDGPASRDCSETPQHQMRDLEPGPSEPSPSSRSETAGWTTYKSTEFTNPPSPDCSGCKPPEGGGENKP